MITPDFIGQVYEDTLTGDIWRANSLTIGDWILICTPGSAPVGNVQGAGDPSVVLPDFVGQVYKDILTGNLWRSNTETIGDWTLELQNSKLEWQPSGLCILNRAKFALLENNEFTSLVLKNTTSGGISVEVDFTLQTLTSTDLLTIDQAINAALVIDNCDVLNTVNFSVLTDVTDQISISNAPLLATVAFPALETVPIFTLDTLPALATLTLSALITVSGTFTITACAILTTVNLSTMVTAGGLSIHDNPALTTLSLLAWVPPNGSINNFEANALNASTVNLILEQGVANAGFVSGTINLFGGTNAAPSGQGVADVITLQGRGVTVTHN